jgi:hypothetical protein
MDELLSFVSGRARAVCLVAVMAGAVGAAALVAPAGAAASCGEPPAGHLYFNGTQTEGVIKVGSTASATGVSGTVTCGLLSEITLTFEIPAEGVKYNPFTLKLLGFLPLESTLNVEGTTTGGLSPVTKENEFGEEETLGYNTAFTTPVDSTVSFLGIANCTVGPFSPTLTTGKSGSLEGSILVGSIQSGLSGTLVANEFTIPKIAASRSCPLFLAGLSNLILGLPQKAGGSSLTTKASLTPEL